MKNYMGEMIDLTGDSILNPAGASWWDGTGTHQRNEGQINSISVHHEAQFREHDYDSVARYHAEAKYQEAEPLGPGLEYHYKIDNVGQIFKTRPHATWLYCVGSAENVTTLAICLDGNFDIQEPTREQYEALYQLLQFLCTEQPQFPATWPNVRPHRDFSATACPGSILAPRIYAIQDDASAQAQLLNQGTYDWPSLQPGYTEPTAPVAPGSTVTPPVAETTTTTTTEAPAPVEETTTTTTTQVPETTTTTTTEVQTATTTSTTTTEVPENNFGKPSFWAALWSVVLEVIKYLQGDK